MTDAPARLVAVLGAPLVDPASRTFLPWLLLSAVAAGIWAWRRPGPRSWWRRALAPELWTHRSTRVDAQLLVVRQLLRGLAPVPQLGATWGLAVGMVRWLDANVGPSTLPPDDRPF